jgi:hypothetical protein
METALATALATLAALSWKRPFLAASLAGCAASLRPEMVPWALVLACSFALVAPPPSRMRVAAAAIVAILPFSACTLVRVARFGHPAPLALTAKPGDLGYGVLYAASAALTSVGVILACAPFAAARERGPGGAIALAGWTHLVAVALAGGDWMPYARLVAPVVPSLLYASVLIGSEGEARRRWALRGRAAVAIGLGLRTVIVAAPPGRQVGPDREGLVRTVSPLVTGRRRVATVDVGWVSAATEADIVDLAGVTDPEIAVLGGGHTSKRVDAALLLAKSPEALLLYAHASDLPLARWQEAVFPRVVEARLARSELLASHFVPAAFVPLGATAEGYYVLLAKRETASEVPAAPAPRGDRPRP